jgi:hypothetical protein
VIGDTCGGFRRFAIANEKCREAKCGIAGSSSKKGRQPSVCLRRSRGWRREGPGPQFLDAWPALGDGSRSDGLGRGGRVSTFGAAQTVEFDGIVPAVEGAELGRGLPDEVHARLHTHPWARRPLSSVNLSMSRKLQLVPGKLPRR